MMEALSPLVSSFFSRDLSQAASLEDGPIDRNVNVLLNSLLLYPRIP